MYGLFAKQCVTRSSASPPIFSPEPTHRSERRHTLMQLQPISCASGAANCSSCCRKYACLGSAYISHERLVDQRSCKVLHIFNA
jgi:hypothetical protein